MNFGCQNMVDPLRKVLIKHPRDAYQNQTTVDRQSINLKYNSVPNFEISNEDLIFFDEDSCSLITRPNSSLRCAPGFVRLIIKMDQNKSHWGNDT